jgi:hypothetical protein
MALGLGMGLFVIGTLGAAVNYLQQFLDSAGKTFKDSAGKNFLVNSRD